MSTPVTFDTSTPRFSLPNMFGGQAQKEFFINEAFGRIDTLLHTSIVGEAATPPPSPADGECWLVQSPAAGDWAGYEDNLASWQGGAWLYVAPEPGLRVIDVSTGGMLFFDGSWRRLIAPTDPSGGSVIDSEARQAIDDIIATLRDAGIFPTN